MVCFLLFSYIFITKLHITRKNITSYCNDLKNDSLQYASIETNSYANNKISKI